MKSPGGDGGNTILYEFDHGPERANTLGFGID